jgi:hypothetical protein
VSARERVGLRWTWGRVVYTFNIGNSSSRHGSQSALEAITAELKSRIGCPSSLGQAFPYLVGLAAFHLFPLFPGG